MNAERRRAPKPVVGACLILGSAFGLGHAAEPPAAASPPGHLSAWPVGVPSPDFHLQGTHGERRTMRSFQGYVTVVTFGYANCPGVCSVELQKLATAVRALGAGRAGVRVVFITLDPERDGPGQLTKFVHRFDPAFVALRGSARQTDEAIRRFSIESARLPGDGNYLIDHTVQEFVFDRAGHLRFVGAADSTPEDLTHYVSMLLGTRPS